MADTGRLIEMGVGLFLFLYVVGAMVPAALTAAINGSTTGSVSNVWGTSITSLWGILGIFIVVAVVLLVYSHVKGSS